MLQCVDVLREMSRDALSRVRSWSMLIFCLS